MRGKTHEKTDAVLREGMRLVPRSPPLQRRCLSCGTTLCAAMRRDWVDRRSLRKVPAPCGFRVRARIRSRGCEGHGCPKAQPRRCPLPAALLAGSVAGRDSAVDPRRRRRRRRRGGALTIIIIGACRGCRRRSSARGLHHDHRQVPIVIMVALVPASFGRIRRNRVSQPGAGICD